MKATYSAEPSDVSIQFGLDDLATSSERGDVKQAFAGAAVKAEPEDVV